MACSAHQVCLLDSVTLNLWSHQHCDFGFHSLNPPWLISGVLRVESDTSVKGLFLLPRPLDPVSASPFRGIIAIWSLCRVLPVDLDEPATSSNYDLNFRIMLDAQKHAQKHLRAP